MRQRCRREADAEEDRLQVTRQELRRRRGQNVRTSLREEAPRLPVAPVRLKFGARRLALRDAQELHGENSHRPRL